MDNNDKENQQAFIEILRRVEQNNCTTFNFLRSWQERCTAKLYYVMSLRTVKQFKDMKIALLDAHCKSVRQGSDDVEVILAAKQLDPVIEFYSKEAATALDMLKEYKAYVFGGHFLDTFLFGRYRTDSDCVDFRKIPWRLF